VFWEDGDEYGILHANTLSTKSSQLMYPGSMTLHNSHALLDDQFRHKTVLAKHYAPLPDRRYLPHTSIYRQGALRTTWGRQPALSMTKQYSGQNGRENPLTNEGQEQHYATLIVNRYTSPGGQFDKKNITSETSGRTHGSQLASKGKHYSYPAASNSAATEKHYSYPAANISAATEKHYSYPAATGRLYINQAALAEKYIPAALDRQYIPAAKDRQPIPAAMNGQYIPAAMDGQYIPAAKDRQPIPAAMNGQYIPAAFDGQPTPAALVGQYIPAAMDGQYSYLGGTDPQLPGQDQRYPSRSPPTSEEVFTGILQTNQFFSFSYVQNRQKRGIFREKYCQRTIG
jgi:hypothetical protein